MAQIVVTQDNTTVVVSNGDTVIIDIPGGGNVTIKAAPGANVKRINIEFRGDDHADTVKFDLSTFSTNNLHIDIKDYDPSDTIALVGGFNRYVDPNNVDEYNYSYIGADGNTYTGYIRAKDKGERDFTDPDRPINICFAAGAIIDTELLRASERPPTTELTGATELSGAIELARTGSASESSDETAQSQAMGRATTTSSTPATNAWTARDRGERALASYSYNWQAGLPGWEISFHPGRQGVLGYTFVQEQRIEVYVRSAMSDALLAHVVAHELGHAIDVTLNSGDDRRRWQEQRAIDEKAWWPGNGATDFSTGAGDFAESFASWQVGDASFRSNLGDPPTDADNALMAELASG